LNRINTRWTAQEEHRLKLLRDDGEPWSEIAKLAVSVACLDRTDVNTSQAFPDRSEGSVKKHWYKVIGTANLFLNILKSCEVHAPGAIRGR
jgi:hypothetical protein